MKTESRLPHFEGCKSNEIRLDINEHVSLITFEFIPEKPVNSFPFVIITGLATMIDSFMNIVSRLSKTHTVYYIETRDKTSSRMLKEGDYSIQAMGYDVARIIEMLRLQDNGYYFIGYSLGSPVIAEGYRHLHAKPRCIVFMEPTAEFNYPAWSLFVIRYCGTFMFNVLRFAAKKYLTTFVINKEEDRQMMVISFHSIDHADPVKLKNAILSIAGYKIWERLPDIKCPSLIVGTTKDGLHRDEDLQKMLRILQNGSYIDLETNERTHNEEMAEVIMQFISAAKL
jgi:pimeloyl-ACP methyl ester carboxylesterase